ncbi:probable glycosyltransferase STELLO2 [Haliotis rufescens]|uniref:probable glycosyltransferase STELLO2 n=1 Tax=Haliotis rufescens TaxID=6454 RepID=UPI00201E7C19|nr:probable glycosyltransferase STELLO2 [Haliotis rufescens]
MTTGESLFSLSRNNKSWSGMSYGKGRVGSPMRSYYLFLFPFSARKTLFVSFVLCQVFIMYMFWKWYDVMLAHRRLGSVSQAQSSGKWIITSSYTGNDVIGIAGWTVLSLGHTDTRIFCRFSGCAVLNSTEEETTTQYENDKWLSKRIGAYLHAISRGAKVICVARHLDAGTMKLIKRMADNMPESGIMLMSNKTFIGPHEVFNNEIGKLTKFYNDFYIEKHISALIMSSFSPTQGETTQEKLSSNCDSYPPVFLPINTYTYLSTHIDVFRYDAFWALLLRDIGNGDMIIQRLLWEIPGHIGIYPACTSERTGTSNNKRDVNVPSALLSWKCVHGLDILKCLENAMTIMAGELLVTMRDLHMINKWVSELTSIKYQTPQREAQPIQPRENPTLGAAGTVPKRTSVNSESHEQLKLLCPTSVRRFPNKVQTRVSCQVSTAQCIKPSRHAQTVTTVANFVTLSVTARWGRELRKWTFAVGSLC